MSNCRSASFIRSIALASKSRRSWRAKRCPGVVSLAASRSRAGSRLPRRVTVHRYVPRARSPGPRKQHDPCESVPADRLLSDTAMPETAWPFAQILRQSSGRVSQGFLHDVGRIESRCEPSVQPRRNHSSHLASMLLHKAPHRIRTSPWPASRSNVSSSGSRRARVHHRPRPVSSKQDVRTGLILAAAVIACKPQVEFVKNKIEKPVTFYCEALDLEKGKGP